MKTPKNRNKSRQRSTDGPKPNFATISEAELESYLRAALERVRRNMDPGKRKTVSLQVIQSRTFCGFRVVDSQSGQFADVSLTEIPPTICLQHHDRLLQNATRLKKAWLMMVALLGRELFKCSDPDLSVANYLEFDNNQLKAQIKDLRDDVNTVGKKAFLRWSAKDADGKVSWLAERFDEWKSPIHCLGRVYEVERAAGSLAHRRHMDCPPYAQVLLQGFHGAGIRHPEYHLATDLAVLYNLFLDSVEPFASLEAGESAQLPEHGQSLGRSVILACFNLLEAFITGLAAAHLHSHPNTKPEAAQKLRGLSSKGKYVDLRLEQKYSEFLPLIIGRPWPDSDKPPFSDLFGRCKLQRNALAHPSMPVQSEDDRRVQNEFRFHDITIEGVRETVELTQDAVCRVWNLVHRKPKPSWLKLRQENGRFPHVSVYLAPAEVRTPATITPSNGKKSP